MPLNFALSNALPFTLAVLAIALIFNAGRLFSRLIQQNLRLAPAKHSKHPVGFDDIFLNITAACLLITLAMVSSL